MRCLRTRSIGFAQNAADLRATRRSVVDMESKSYAGMLTLGSFGFAEVPDTVVELDDVSIEQK